MSNKVKVPGGAFYAGDGLTVDHVTRTVSGVQSDWNQNDSTAADYVKNRPFYEYSSPLIDEISVQCNTKLSDVSGYEGSIYYRFNAMRSSATDADIFQVIFDGIPYIVRREKKIDPLRIDSFTFVEFVGDPYLEKFPFAIEFNYDRNIIFTKSAGSHTFIVNNYELKQISEKFIPDSVKHMYVYITQNTDGTFSADKTFAEIKEHIINRGTVSAIFDNLNMVAIIIDPEMLIFYGFSEGDYLFLSIGSNGSVVANEFDLYNKFVSLHQGTTDSGKFLTVGEDGVVAPSDLILPSSTPGSTKKFKITVDDSGTISATEVT